MTTSVELSSEGPVRVLTINRPEKLNALSAEVLLDLERAIADIVADSDVRAAVLTGAGKAFVAGADIAAMQQMSVEEAEEFAALGHRVFDSIESARFPIVAAVNGFALGGGCELALACDFIYASEKAKFGQPEVALGVVPGFGGTQRLPRRIGAAMARELIYSGKMIGAEEALRIGLVNAVFPVDGLLEAANAVAREIAKKGPVAVSKAKQVISEGMDEALASANAKERRAFADCFATEDQTEGMVAFLAKRAAEFAGR